MTETGGQTQRFQHVVVGCGGIGSAALFWLAKKTHGQKSKPGFDGKVLGLEQFSLGHDNGASQDHSRIIRLAYDEDCYMALAPHAYSAWRAVEAESGLDLVTKCGSLIFGPKSSPHMQRYIASTTKSGIYMEVFQDLVEAKQRFPQFSFADDDVVVYQPDGGLVDARKANATHISLAKSQGAVVRENTRVEAVRPLQNGDGGFEIVTSKGLVICDKLVLCADAWTNELLQSMGQATLPLRITQEQVTYFSTTKIKDFIPRNFPVWIAYEEPGDRCFYGLPIYGEVGTKAGKHQGGDEVTTSTRNFVPNARVEAETLDFLSRKIPDSAGPVLYTKTCIYTLLPDDNFVIGVLPNLSNCSIALGAGHAFKFASLIGQILAELSVFGQTVYPIKAFSAARFYTPSKL